MRLDTNLLLAVDCLARLTLARDRPTVGSARKGTRPPYSSLSSLACLATPVRFPRLNELCD
jgi:hypothetical protein